MTKHLTLTYHTDPGHGWLEVPRAEIEALLLPAELREASTSAGTDLSTIPPERIVRRSGT